MIECQGYRDTKENRFYFFKEMLKQMLASIWGVFVRGKNAG
jgi:hypothetical protein